MSYLTLSLKTTSSLEHQNILKLIMFLAGTLLYMLKIVLLHVLVVRVPVHLKEAFSRYIYFLLIYCFLVM